MKVITVRDTPPYGHAPTHQISLTYLERQNIVFTVTRPTLIFASNPMNFYTEFG
jgi:hypothetical protein